MKQQPRAASSTHRRLEMLRDEVLGDGVVPVVPACRRTAGHQPHLDLCSVSPRPECGKARLQTLNEVRMQQQQQPLALCDRLMEQALQLVAHGAGAKEAGRRSMRG